MSNDHHKDITDYMDRTWESISGGRGENFSYIPSRDPLYGSRISFDVNGVTMSHQLPSFATILDIQKWMEGIVDR